MKAKTSFAIDQIISNPQKVFLTDSLGAALTSFLLSMILSRFENEFGMPKAVLFNLSLVAGIYAVYSICCCFFVQGNWRLFLRIIVIANLLYACSTVGLVIYFYKSLTVLGITYFLLELLVIGILISVEMKALSYGQDKG
ncbi:hypothetical protein GVN16_12760 [Emticicia sp. CRIBPO]|uniref:hypothetical protein n=1 Tax=Emticicia sp. CRIBPO TaxID=2683258 RepID=UPI00141267DC|nr:hypothetical protein [Emticicia sp. CRIBPO]NBA86637.1 hypothetical protein [Emticicia sp. CRIBPO]